MEANRVMMEANRVMMEVKSNRRQSGLGRFEWSCTHVGRLDEPSIVRLSHNALDMI